jgi:D-alanine-D-alanine ligase
MKRLGILFGGRSGEHEISLMSASSVIKAMENSNFQIVMIGISKNGEWLKYDGSVDYIENGEWEKNASHFHLGSLKEEIDIALPILHGPYGEDGTIQGLFEMMDIPYCGCGVLASASAMDKVISKELFAKAGLPVCKYKLVFSEKLNDRNDILEEIKKIENYISYPMFVKPANMGSSVGISKARTRGGLEEALQIAKKYDRRIIIEEGIDCREFEAGVIGNFDAEVSIIGEILPSAEFYDYKAKYFDGGKSKICVPAEIGEDMAVKIKNLSLRAYETIDGSGFARIDFLQDRKNGEIYINEINTIPGFTKFSMFPLLWEHTGVLYRDLIERIVELGYERYNAKNNR